MRYQKLDITPPRRAGERELRINEERYRDLFEGSPIGIAFLDPNGRITECNPALERLLGYAAEELTGRHIRQIIESPDVDHDRLPEALLGHHIEAEATCVGKLRRITARIALSAMQDERGDVRCVHLMVNDLTVQKELEAKSQQAEKLAAVGRLAGGIAHDFNNLLTTINGVGDLVLQEMSRDDARRADVEEIRKAGERAALLTRQLLAFSRQQVLQPRVLDLNAVIVDTGPMLKRLLGDGVELTIHAQDGILPVKADPGQILQVLLNLAVNARDAMPYGGRLEVATDQRVITPAEARAAEVAQPGTYVVLTVRDTGRGMDPHTLAHLFEPFFTTKEVGTGTGLGLATVYGIVKQSGGAITVETEVGEGTTFKVLLPVDEATAVPRERSTATAQRGNETVLIAEDEPNVRSYVARVLRRAGYRVVEAEDGIQALTIARLETSPIDLLLADAVMPGMSGAELMIRLKRQRPEVKTLVMSGYTRDTMKEHGVDVGELDFLQKPVSPATLIDAVRAVLDGLPVGQAAEPVAI